MFSYEYGDKVNYVFKKYDGNLEDILKGALDKSQEVAKLQKYPGSKLQHWLWQGVVDVVGALKFFHTKEFLRPEVEGKHYAAHFDVKPANILVDQNTSFVLADFGDAQIVKIGSDFTANGGDPNYRPPKRPRDSRWTQAYDVWSMACVLTEVIEYIMNGSDALQKFRDDRCSDRKGDYAFWKLYPGKNDFGLRPSVEKALERFRDPHDQYLNSVTDLLGRMFSIEAAQRPSLEECCAVLSQNVPTDSFPLLDEGEISISGLGTKPLLRNM
jgi:serine/threonine protein kinase